MSDSDQARAVIWDLPTRVFHWLFVASFVVEWLTFDDNRFLFIHVYAGYVFLSLLIFRLIWGLVGTHYARFHTFAYDWGSVSAYLKGLLNGQAMRHIGHNPIGGWAIFFMLVLALVVCVAGLLTLGGEENHGPLRNIVSFGVGTHSHDVHNILAWALLGFTLVHVAGVIVESFIHKDNLIWAMISGYKDKTAGVASVHGHHYLGLFIVVTVVVSGFVYFHGYITETADHLYQPYKGPDLPDNELWRSECSDCHFAYHPTLLPERSWRLIMKQQSDHFGDDLYLDEDTIAELLDFHVKYSAESGLTEPARKILYYTPENETPIRITETHYWVHKHEDIKPEYWKSKKIRTKGNCSACHLDAKEGTYEDSDMRLPTLE